MGSEMPYSGNCPNCRGALTDGWLGMWDAFYGQTVRWAADKPGYVRMKRPEAGAVVLASRSGGADVRRALRCAECGFTVVPPDDSYDTAEGVHAAARRSRALLAAFIAAGLILAGALFSLVLWIAS